MIRKVMDFVAWWFGYVRLQRQCGPELFECSVRVPGLSGSALHHQQLLIANPNGTVAGVLSGERNHGVTLSCSTKAKKFFFNFFGSLSNADEQDDVLYGKIARLLQVNMQALVQQTNALITDEIKQQEGLKYESMLQQLVAIQQTLQNVPVQVVDKGVANEEMQKLLQQFATKLENAVKEVVSQRQEMEQWLKNDGQQVQAASQQIMATLETSIEQHASEQQKVEEAKIAGLQEGLTTMMHVLIEQVLPLLDKIAHKGENNDGADILKRPVTRQQFNELGDTVHQLALIVQALDGERVFNTSRSILQEGERLNGNGAADVVDVPPKQKRRPSAPKKPTRSGARNGSRSRL